MDVLDAETDEVRPATCQDLRDLIRLVNSYGLGGNYPVMPQDLPPLMRALACFKICWETSDNIRPFDYQHIRQTRYIYEMHQVMGQPFTITLCVPQPLRIDEKDLDIFLSFYPEWKRGADLNFWILDYPMLGITKPITSTGCLAMQMANMFGVRTLFHLFDEELELPVGFSGGLPTDLRNVCWAWGHPRQHLYAFLNSRILAQLCGLDPPQYVRGGTLLESSSSAVDAQAALEKMGIAMVAALQGVRHFSGAGSLCVDDLFSGVQFVIDLEIVRYVQETVESFHPPSDLVSTDGLYEMLRDVSLEKDEFLSHPDTVAKFRSLLPSSDRIRREKLRSWLTHRSLLKDRAREECIERIRGTEQKFHLPDEQQRELDRIYREAEADLAGYTART
jgi:trimethylamine:corrinoid methyltransferase-like protein